MKSLRVGWVAVVAAGVLVIAITVLASRSARDSGSLGEGSEGESSTAELTQRSSRPVPDREQVADVEGPGAMRTPAADTADTAPGRSAQSGLGESGNRDDSKAVSPVSVTAAFHIDRPNKTSGLMQVVVAGIDDDDRTAIDVEQGEDRATCSLAPGEYVAAVWLKGAGLGAVVTFVVSSDPVQVELTAPYTFDLEFPVQDADTSAPISLARFVLERTDLNSGWMQPAIPAALSDTEGYVRLAGMTPGRWRLVGSADGYVSDERTFDYPGSQEAKARREGLISLKTFRLPSSREIRFQLVNHRSWDDLTEFSVSHTNTGKPVRFSPEGTASLLLGWFNEPLYIKLDYPGLWSSVRYLDGGLPDADEVHEIDIGGPMDLEVELQIAPEILDALAERSPHLAVSFRADNQDATKFGVDIQGPTTAVFRGIKADHVVVSLETTDSELPMDWKSLRVEMEPEGRTSCTLVLDSMPVELHVIDGAGDPIAAFHCEIRQIPDDTTWASGGMTDERGVLGVGRVPHGQCSLFGVLESDFVFAIDVAIDLTQPTSIIEVPIAPVAATFVEVRSPSGPVEGVPVKFFGTTTDYLFHMDWTGVNGRTSEIQLVTRSRAMIRLDLEERWTPTPEFDLEPGRNAVTVYETGHLRVTSAAHLGDVRSIDFGATLADWVDEGRIEVETTDGGALRCRVPVGTYEVTQGTSESRRIEVRAGKLTPSGI